MTQKIRIKDIAEKAGVSVGTVDRILHNRPNVSKEAREKVEQVMNTSRIMAIISALALSILFRHSSLLVRLVSSSNRKAPGITRMSAKTALSI